MEYTFSYNQGRPSEGRTKWGDADAKANPYPDSFLSHYERFWTKVTQNT